MGVCVRVCVGGGIGNVQVDGGGALKSTQMEWFEMIEDCGMGL